MAMDFLKNPYLTALCILLVELLINSLLLLALGSEFSLRKLLLTYVTDSGGFVVPPALLFLIAGMFVASRTKLAASWKYILKLTLLYLAPTIIVTLLGGLVSILLGGPLVIVFALLVLVLPALIWSISFKIGQFIVLKLQNN